jgi:hypothetical protein
VKLIMHFLPHAPLSLFLLAQVKRVIAMFELELETIQRGAEESQENWAFQVRENRLLQKKLKEANNRADIMEGAVEKLSNEVVKTQDGVRTSRASGDFSDDEVHGFGWSDGREADSGEYTVEIEEIFDAPLAIDENDVVKVAAAVDGRSHGAIWRQPESISPSVDLEIKNEILGSSSQGAVGKSSDVTWEGADGSTMTVAAATAREMLAPSVAQLATVVVAAAPTTVEVNAAFGSPGSLGSLETTSGQRTPTGPTTQNTSPCGTWEVDATVLQSPSGVNKSGPELRVKLEYVACGGESREAAEQNACEGRPESMMSSSSVESELYGAPQPFSANGRAMPLHTVTTPYASPGSSPTIVIGATVVAPLPDGNDATDIDFNCSGIAHIDRAVREVSTSLKLRACPLPKAIVGAEKLTASNLLYLANSQDAKDLQESVTWTASVGTDWEVPSTPESRPSSQELDGASTADDRPPAAVFAALFTGALLTQPRPPSQTPGDS